MVNRTKAKKKKTNQNFSSLTLSEKKRGERESSTAKKGRIRPTKLKNLVKKSKRLTSHVRVIKTPTPGGGRKREIENT